MALGIVVGLTSPLWPDDRSPGAFQAIELAQTPAAEVAPLVERALALRGETAEVVVDGQRNRLLVRASVPVQKHVRDLVKTFDSQPAGRVVRANTETRPTANVRASYSAAVEERAAKAPSTPAPRSQQQSMRRPVAKAKKVRPEKDTTPWPYQEVQKLVAKPADSAVEAVVETTAVPLHHLAADKLPERLKALLGNRLLPLVTTNEDVASFIVQVTGRTPLEIHVDKRADQVVLRGPELATRHCARLIEAFDAEPMETSSRTRVVSLRGPSSPHVQKALAAVANSGGKRTTRASSSRLMARLFQPRRADDAAADDDQPGDAAQPDANEAMPDEAMPEEEDDLHGALSGDVEIEQVPDLGAIIVRGSERDVERVMKIIEEIERLSAEAEPMIEIYPLKHIGSEAMADVVEPLYGAEFAPRQGRVNILPLIHPNALLLIGRPESVKAVIDLVVRLDQPGGPTSQFEVFRLKHATATAAAATLNQTFGTFNFGLGVRLRVTADTRTNALIVQAGPRDLLEVRKLLKQLDVPGSAAVNELRLFRLRYASAAEVAAMLNAAVQNNPQQQGQAGQAGQAQQQGQQQRGQGGGGQFQQQQQQQPQQQQVAPQQAATQQQPAQQPGQQGAAQETKSVMLRLLTVDEQGRRQLSVGHLGDIRISADMKSNTVVVSAPADSLDLIAALISQLDVANAVPAQIKVFSLTNGDATNMVTMLEDLFQISGTSVAVNGPQQEPQVTTEEGGGVPLRFSVDARTNSIIASGSASDLTVVEAILLRLDDSDVRERSTMVYKLKNAPALDVAVAINEYLQKERQTQQTAPGLLSPFEKIEREVVVVPELVTNSLIVSATPRFYDEINKIVQQLDARSPMVMIQVLIAEVTLNNVDEFGVELGLQNSVMFDRGLLSNLQLINQSSTQAVAGGGTITANTQNVVAANNTPGFDFNNAALHGATPAATTGGTTTPNTFGIGLPNSGAATSLNTASVLGTQGLSNFGLGRTNGDLGYGGLVLSLSSDTVNFLLRALRERDRLDILSRPQIMTLDNQPAYIVVGQRVPLLGSSTVGLTGSTTGVQYTPVGLIVAVTPRITPDGLVVMEIDAEKSLLGPLNQGVAVGFGSLGQVLRQPIINLTQAQTTISAMDGQTIVFGGMISQSSQVIQRRVPGLSEIPIFGRLFRYDYQNGKKSELLIIMTPHIVRNQADAERLKRLEAGRISWCLADVQKIHGEAGFRNRTDEWLDKEIPTIYPDSDPTGAAGGAEPVPTPNGQPMRGPAPGPRLRMPGPMPQGQPMSAAPPAAGPPRRPMPVGVPNGASPNEVRLRQPAAGPNMGPRSSAAVRAAPPPVSHRRQNERPVVQRLQYETPSAEAPARIPAGPQ